MHTLRILLVLLITLVAGALWAQAADTTPPSVPTGLSGSTVSPTQIDLTWTAATDNVGVASYRIYRDGSFLGASSTTAYSDPTATATTSYSYTVVACDAAGNASSPGAAFAIATGHAYYVAPGGKDDNPGTLASPWATPLKAWTAANAGDTVYFRAGTYNVESQIWTKYFGHDGTAANPIVFRNYPGETATITSNVGTVFVIEKDYNRVEGLNFVGPATATWFQVSYDVKATNFTASRCIASMGAGGDNSGFVYLGGGATGTVVEHCRITGPGYNGVHLNSAGIICFKTEGVRFIHNEISNTMIGIYFKFANPQDNLTPGIEIAYNYIHETGRNSMQLNCNHASIHDNVIGANNAGILVTESNGGPGGDGNVFAHNTFAGNIGFSLNFDTNGTDTVPGAIANILRANLFTAKVWAHWYSSVPHITQSDYNLFVSGAEAIGETEVNYSLATWKTHTGGDAHSLAGTPTFVGGASPTTLAGFALAANSLGKFAAHDGLDIGANIALVGPQDFPAPNHPPVLSSIGNQTIPAGEKIQFTVQGTDADGDGLQYSATGGQ